MADEGNSNNWLMKLVVGVAGAVVGTLATAAVVVLLNASGKDVQVSANTEAIRELRGEVSTLKQQRAGDNARLDALESMVRDIWTVTVKGGQR
jgi:type II secretory pathway pseudopilin PulG